MGVELFAGMPVSDYAAALDWYTRVLGAPPSFHPHDTEAVWQLAEHRFVYVVQRPDRAGGGEQTLIVDDLDERLAAVAARGVEPARREEYDNGVRKITYRDPDGNELSFGGLPPEAG